MSFSPQWLALREPVDHRSRGAVLARRLAAHLSGRDDVRVVDLGCGTGSNLRATSVLLGPSQHWTLVDLDTRLIGAAMSCLMDWADVAETRSDVLRLRKDGRTVDVVFRQGDLAADLDGALGTGAIDLVTASALFDLASRTFMDRFAGAIARRRTAFYTVLTYNGIQRWTPPHAADAALEAAFHAHQCTEKGLGPGPAAGPASARELAAAFRSVGYRIEEGDSPWMLGPADTADVGLVAELARGFADAVRETGQVPEADIAAWCAVQRTGATVGHTDTLALPA